MKRLISSILLLPYVAASTSFDFNLEQDNLPGLEAKPKFKYYFTAALEYDNKHECSGAFLNGNTIVTAASCIKGDIGSWRASYKRHDLSVSAENEKSKSLKIKSQTPHPEYVPNTKAYDVSVWKADAPGGSKTFINLDDGRWSNAGDFLLTIIGWGVGTHHTNLQREIQASIIRGSKCRSLYPTLDNFSHFCIFYPQGTSSYCIYEPGSPIIINKNGENLLVGIASSDTCIDEKTPGIFIKAGSFQKFVAKLVRAEMNNHVNATMHLKHPQRIVERFNE